MPIMRDIDSIKSIDEISDFAHKNKEPIFVMKNDNCEFVVMSYECYDDLMKVEHIDQAIFESEEKALNGGRAVGATQVFQDLINDMKFREMTFDGITYNVLTDEELNDFIYEIKLKTELEIQHKRLLNGEITTMEFDDFVKKRQLKYSKAQD